MKLSKVLLGIGLSALSTFAFAQNLLLVNATSSDLNAIYISSSDENEWEENLIEGSILPSGNQVTVTIDGQYNKFDLMIESTDGGQEDYRNFPGTTSKIVLQGAGKADYNY